MKRIVFHIGTHKTATTTIQNTLAANRNFLKTQGVWYATTDRSPHPHQTKHLGLLRALQSGAEAVMAERDALWEEFEGSGCDTLLLSEEHLSSLRCHRLSWMECFAELGRVEAVCLLRRQDIMLESMWGQVIKSGNNVGAIDQYYQKPHVAQQLRYNLMLQEWEKFSDVSVLSFDEAKELGVMRAFCQAASIPIVDAERSRNVSPSVNCTLMMLEIVRAGVPLNKHRIIRAFQDDKARHVLGRRLRREVLKSMAECNQWLEHKYNIRFSDKIPDEPEEPITYPDPEAVARAMARLSLKQGAAKTRKRAGAETSVKP